MKNIKIIFCFLNKTAFALELPDTILIENIQSHFPESLSSRAIGEIRFYRAGKECKVGRTLLDCDIRDGAVVFLNRITQASVGFPPVLEDHPDCVGYGSIPDDQIVPFNRKMRSPETDFAASRSTQARTSDGERQPLLPPTPTYQDRHRLIHAFRASGETLLSSGDYMQLRALRGDTLKAGIFGVMEDKLMDDGLERAVFVSRVRSILHGPEGGDDHRAYQILAAGQGIVTRFVQFFSPASMQTDAADQLHALIRHQATHEHGMNPADIDEMFTPLPAAANSAPQMSARGGDEDNDY